MTGKLFKIKLKKGDTVMVRSGKYKGKVGKVLKVYPKDNKLTVDGVNIVKRHIKPTQLRPQGGIQEMTKPIWASKVGLLDNVARKPSRIGYKLDDKAQKIRILRTSGKEVK